MLRFKWWEIALVLGSAVVWTVLEDALHLSSWVAGLATGLTVLVIGVPAYAIRRHSKIGL